ncbi:MAG: EscU/YscU/HrcU family type III secretion system export apparatus switch protein, partial [bacterium]
MVKEDENGQEKTEEATPRKLREARQKGQVPKSKEFPAALTMLAAVLFASLLGKQFIFEISRIFENCFTHIKTGNITIFTLITFLKEIVPGFAHYLIGFMLFLMIMGVAGNLAMSGFVFSMESIKIDFTKINPVKKFKEIFMSVNSFVELLKGVLKLTVFVLLSSWIIISHSNKIMSSGKLSTMGIIFQLGEIFIKILLAGLLFYLLIGAFDIIYQKWKFKDEMKMTKKETKDDHKNTDGDPKMKSERKRRGREMLSQHSKDEVEGADVVITNPTHYAVALKYDKQNMAVPRVVAKGSDFMAQQIKLIA